MLSLSKLSAFAAEMDMSQQVEEINRELHLVEHQSQIDSDILTALGFDINNLRVLQPEEMIELYISDEYTTATEVEFRKALELLPYIEDALEYRNKIWCAAIKRDNWLNVNMDAPLDKINETLFYKLVELCFMLDSEIESALPPVDTFLTSPELADLLSDKSFQYLLKLSYEHMRENFK
jgi:nuclear pore complex protein Nup133